MDLHFFKYQGTGNDFVIFDNREGTYSHLTQEQIALLCHRRFGIGADGLMLLNAHSSYDFEMKYYNADGAEGSMCGNGGRCLVQFAWDLGIRSLLISFIAIDGPHEAKVNADGTVSLKMQDVEGISYVGNDALLNTGSPHYIKLVKNLQQFDVFNEGKSIRYNPAISEKGVNVNFTESLGTDSIAVRTYERGVEDETFSCGTGVTAAAIVCFGQEPGHRSVAIHTKGGQLSVDFEFDGSKYSQVWLKGPAQRVFEGNIFIDSY